MVYTNISKYMPTTSIKHTTIFIHFVYKYGIYFLKVYTFRIIKLQIHLMKTLEY
jgi:hypothetical protein